MDTVTTTFRPIAGSYLTPISPEPAARDAFYRLFSAIRAFHCTGGVGCQRRPVREPQRVMPVSLSAAYNLIARITVSHPPPMAAMALPRD